MDESFLPFNQIIGKLLDIDGDIHDEENGIHSYIYSLDIGTPVELDVFRDENGNLQLGLVPPLYRVNTSYRPSYHNISLIAEKHHTEPDGD